MSLTCVRLHQGRTESAPRPTPAAPPPAVARTTSARPRPWRELALIAALFLVYKLGRLAVAGHVALAYRNARLVWGFERRLHLSDETDAQRLLLHNHVLVQAVNGFYAYVHFPATIAFLLWMYLRRPSYYRQARRTLAALTALALAVHVLFPLAPPRLLTGIGLIDTAAQYGPSVYGSPQSDTLSNQYAAMPSLHVGWALVIALTLITTTRSRWRWLWLAHPIATTFVVIATANHYWLDALVASVLVAGVHLVLRPRPGRATRPAPTRLRAVAPTPAQHAGTSG